MTNAMPAHDVRTLPNAFLFSSAEVRTAVDERGESWFCAKDVCQALEITWNGAGRTLQTLPKHWVMVASQATIQGDRDTYFISEPGLYRLIFRSNKPKAVEFADWVCEEVLPSIRKQGFYGQVTAQQQIQLSNLMLKLLGKLTSKDAFVYTMVTKRLRNVCNLLGEPMPQMKLLGQKRDQLELEV